MSDTFKDRFLAEAGERPYAWAASLGLPKTLVTAILRGGDDYRPIKRTIERLAKATGKHPEWWLHGTDEAQAVEPAISVQPVAAPIGTIAGGGRADPKLLALAIQAVEEWSLERGVQIPPERKGAIIAVLYDYLCKGADETAVQGLLQVVA